MPLLQDWAVKLTELRHVARRDPIPVTMPICPAFFEGQVTFVSSETKAEEMADLAEQRPIAWMGFDTEYRFDRARLGCCQKSAGF